MFEGFRPETIDFLWGIRLNNRKDWFEAHKQDYLNYLYRPMQALGELLYEPLRDMPGMCCKVSRIYRDARYAHGTPYKDSLWISLRRETEFWGEHPCLFFEIRPETYNCGFLLCSPKADAMQRWRDLLADKPDDFLKLVQKVQRDTGIELTGDHYRRKKPCPDARLEPYYNLKNMFCYAEKPIGPELFAPEIAVTAAKTLRDMLSLNEYCQKFAY